MNGSDRFTRRALMRAGAGVALKRASLPSGARASRYSSEQVLRVAGSPNGISSFDPALSRDLHTNFFHRQIHRGLLHFDASLRPEPAVAQSVEALDGGRRYRFVLREGVTFASGKPVDAPAVATALSRALNPLTGGGDPALLAAPTYLGDIEGADDVLAGRLQRVPGIDVESDLSLTISLVAASGTFPMRLCSVPASIVDTSDIREIAGLPVGPTGLGPYRVSSVDLDQSIRLEASPAWIGSPPSVTSIDLRIGIHAMNPFNLFQSGELDLIPSLHRQLAPLAEDDAMGIDGQLLSTPLYAMAYIAFGTSVPPLEDRHVRRALTMAFPTHRLATNVFQGQVEPARGLIPQGMLDYEWPDAMPGFDPEAARAELGRSAYAERSDVPPIELHATDTEPLVPFSETIERELGLDVRVYDMAWGDLLAGLSSRSFSAYGLYWGADYPDPESMLWMLYGAASGDNYLGYANERFEQALSGARSATNGYERIARYGEAEHMLLDDGVCLPLYQDIGHTLVRRGVKGVRPTPMGLLGLESVRFAEG